MRRLYILLPDVEFCRLVVGELKEAEVPERHMHVVASVTQSLEGLPEAGVLQKTEVLHGLEWGALMGGAAGLLGGWLVVTYPPPAMAHPGQTLGYGAIALCTVLGVIFGVLVSALVKSSEHNRRLDYFEAAIEAGQVLLMVDIPKSDVERTKALVLKHHAEADIRVVQPPRR